MFSETKKSLLSFPGEISPKYGGLSRADSLRLYLYTEGIKTMTLNTLETNTPESNDSERDEIISEYKEKFDNLCSRIDVFSPDVEEYHFAKSDFLSALDKIRSSGLDPENQRLERLETATKRLQNVHEYCVSTPENDTDVWERNSSENVLISKENRIREKWGMSPKPLNPTYDEVIEIIENNLVDDFLESKLSDGKTPRFDSGQRGFWKSIISEIKLEREFKKERQQTSRETVLKFRSEYEQIADPPEKLKWDPETRTPELNPDFTDWLDRARKLFKRLNSQKNAIEAYSRNNPGQNRDPYLKRNILQLWGKVNAKLKEYDSKQ